VQVTFFIKLLMTGITIRINLSNPAIAKVSSSENRLLDLLQCHARSVEDSPIIHPQARPWLQTASSAEIVPAIQKAALSHAIACLHSLIPPADAIGFRRT
jgi:hypothetical protein